MMKSVSLKTLTVALLMCVGTMLAGCGGVSADYSQIDLASASGTVTLDNRPLANAMVTFEAPDKTFAFGKTDASGKYTLQFNSEQSGVTPGPKVVRITTVGGTDESAVYEVNPDEETGEGAATGSVEKVPAKYNKTSELTATVASGSNTFDFPLKSAP